MNPSWLHHGGGVDAAAARYGIAPRRWLDLSTGINPRPYPLPTVPATAWHRLPGPDLDRRLREAAAQAWGIADPAWVVPGPGSQALIQWLPRLLPPARVAIPGPTYGEHEACWRDAGHAVSTADEVADDATVVVVVNPNNPDGRRRTPDALRALGHGRTLVVDEAFADVAPETSVAPEAGRSGLVVLRSFGKFYGLAGLRLGFALAEPSVAERLRRALGPWAVNGPAAEIGTRALSDTRWAAEARARLEHDARRLDRLLTGAGLRVVGGTALFRLAEHPDTANVFDRLAGAGILVRAFPEHPTWLRFGLPADDAGFERLRGAL